MEYDGDGVEVLLKKKTPSKHTLRISSYIQILFMWFLKPIPGMVHKIRP